MILIGGGARPEIILSKIISISHGKILVIPLASSRPLHDGLEMVSEFSNLGGEAEVFKCSRYNVDLPECIAQVRSAGLIYFTGGDQVELMKSFKGTRALELIKKRFKADLSLAGSSAGTAIMNRIMLAGASPKGIRPGQAEIHKGFGLLSKLIVDQHFMARKRMDRLLSTVLENPRYVGVGIDEATAIHLSDENELSVLGASKVMIIDARNAKISIDQDGNFISSGVETILLESGQNYMRND